jgi:hypothetical protein
MAMPSTVPGEAVTQLVARLFFDRYAPKLPAGG